MNIGIREIPGSEILMNDSTDAIEKRPTCFVIMPISEVHGYDSGHFARVYEHVLKPAISRAGYNAIRADDTNKTDYIVIGIIRKIIDSEMVLCDYSARNPNVMYELGIRHAFNKPVVLIKDRMTDKVFDIQGLRFHEYDNTLRIDSVEKDIEKISKAISETAGAAASDVNSVIALAGIRVAAAEPEPKTVSQDTQLILEAISNIDRRLKLMEVQTDSQKYFLIRDGKVVFANSTTAELREEVFDKNGRSLGDIIDIHPGDEKIFVRDANGRITPYSASSIKSDGLSSIPF